MKISPEDGKQLVAAVLGSLVTGGVFDDVEDLRKILADLVASDELWRGWGMIATEGKRMIKAELQAREAKDDETVS